MSEIILTLAGVVSFALVHAAHPRRFPGNDRWWKRLARPLGSPRRTLYAMALVALIAGAWGGSRTLDGGATALILSTAFLAAGSALVLAVPLWPRFTWRLCAACALALPLLLVVQAIVEVSHG
jgi:hypothetical protein